MASILKSQARQFSYTLLENCCVGDKLWRLRMYCPELAATIKAGQFVNVNVPSLELAVTRIPLSPAYIDAHTGVLDFVYAVVGEYTRALCRATADDVLSVIGPLGRPWSLPQDSTSELALLFAGGVGAPPIYALAQALSAAQLSCVAFVGARSADKLVGVEEYLEPYTLKTYCATDDGSLGFKGSCIEAYLKAMDEIATISAGRSLLCYACGPDGLLKAIATYAAKSELNCQLSLERMMGCGFGACGSCTVQLKDGTYASCCMNGPIFEARDLAW